MYWINVGLTDNNIVLGKHSGRHAFRSRLVELGFALSDAELNSAFLRFKELADKKKEVSNADLESIVNDEISMLSSSSRNIQRFKLAHCQVISGDKQVPTATISIVDETLGSTHTKAMTGTGPVDAAYKAISQLTSQHVGDLQLLEYTVSSVTAGIDALGEVTVRLQDTTSGRIGIGRSANTDVIVASAQAYLNAINRLESLKGQDLPKNARFSTSIV